MSCGDQNVDDGRGLNANLLAHTAFIHQIIQLTHHTAGSKQNEAAE